MMKHDKTCCKYQFYSNLQREDFMKRKLSSILLILVLSIVMLNGCSSKSDNTTPEETTTQAATEAETESEGETETEAANAPEAEIYVFIAASLSNAMTEIQEMYNQTNPNVTILYNADSSGTLQTQIEEGAECDIFFSAAMKQMTALQEGGYVEADSIDKLLENKVVLIKPVGQETKVTGFENIFEAKNIALAGVDVPVGAYAREIFTNLGISDKVDTMEINEGANVTAVLAAVSEASNEVGVVYATDANSVKDSVEIIATAPEGSLNTPVVYPVGLVKNADADDTQSKAAKDFLEYLTSADALAVFEKYGFSINE
jgi:molybdate transport system substrate-binding protein